MLDTFASVGATRFDVTWTNARRRQGMVSAQRVHGRPGPHPARACSMPRPPKQRNVIVRPHGPGVSFIQLDDLKADQLPRLAPAVFLTLETSPGNFQAWLALAGREDKDFARRVAQGHRRRCDRERRNARRRQPQFQGQVRARLSARRDPRSAARPHDDRGRARRLGLVAAPDELCAAALPARSARRQPQMAELCPCARRCAAQQRGTGPDTQPGGFRVVHDGDHMGLA